jgi:AcrR family transcriptional regulator
VDRRSVRAAATRTAVVDALLGLIREGDLRPTAPRIAARAGVSLRSVFQHFADLESLFAAAADRQTAKIRRLARRLDGEGPLRRRLAAFVAQRVRVLEAIAPVRRAALLMEPFSAEISARLARARRAGRSELQRVFAAELAACPAAEQGEVLAALAAASGFAFWEALRAHQGLSVRRAERAMELIVSAILCRGVDALGRRRRRLQATRRSTAAAGEGDARRGRSVPAQ